MYVARPGDFRQTGSAICFFKRMFKRCRYGPGGQDSGDKDGKEVERV